MKVSATVMLLSVVASESVCSALSVRLPCLPVVNMQLVSQGVGILTPLTSVIVTGLAILASFTDEEFLSELSDIGVFTTIIFVFEYTVFLAIFSMSIGVIYTTYNLGSGVFYAFLFLFCYTILSTLQAIQLIASVSINKSEWAE